MVPQKASDRGGGGFGVGSYTTLQLFNIRGGNFFKSLVKLDEKLIENGLEGQKCLVVCIFWGGCHCPNVTKAKEDNGFLNLIPYH